MARTGLRWSLDDLADATGLGRATLARFELGQPVKPETIEAVFKAFENKRVSFPKGGVVIGLRPVGGAR